MKNTIKSTIEGSRLYKKITSEENIFYSIYSAESYIFEKELLDEDDYRSLIRLGDKFDKGLVDCTVKEVRELLKNVLVKDNLFETKVFFRPKKLNVEEADKETKFISSGNIVSRPMHMASLTTQIAIASILNAVLLEENNGKYELNELGNVLPKNFYGNIPSGKPDYLFEPWYKQYKEYSQVIGDSYTRYLETKEYGYEVTVDLENFFPSIQPLIVYRKIVDLLGGKYINEDMECLKHCLVKLLHMKVTNYGGHGYYLLAPQKQYDLKINYTQGIPQGLPQSYLFGNICMLDVSEKYEKIFEGLAYYYVDDSVIYTNNFRNQEPGKLLREFEDKLKELNTELALLNLEKATLNEEFGRMETSYGNDLLKLYDILDYKIKVHEVTTKSEISTIDVEKVGKPNLKILGKIASLSSFELATTFSDSEEFSLMGKFSEFKRSVQAELKRIKVKGASEKEAGNYQKYLIRYLKFLNFRERLLKSRDSTLNVADYLETIREPFSLKTKSNKLINRKDLDSYFAAYDETSMIVELLFVLKNNYDVSFYEKIKEIINGFDEVVFGRGGSEKAYLSRIINNLSVKINLTRKNFNRYTSIRDAIDMQYPDFTNKQAKVRAEFVKDLTTKLTQETTFFSRIHDMFDTGGAFTLVNMGTSELYRQVLKTLFSKVYSVKPDDNIKVVKQGSKSILYNEYRTLIYLNNRRFRLKPFVAFLEREIADKDSDVLDHSLMEVVDYFVAFTKEPGYVDDLIQIHKYTNEIWKNGSKFLHFYTLHNHEHAIELIAAAIKVIKTVDYFQVSKVDYYILFISCYLHDVSMVLHPDLIKTFINTKNSKSNLITSDFRNDIHSELAGKKIYTMDVGKVKRLLIKYFRKIDYYFESVMRDKHSTDSADFIKTSYDLSFIDEAIREVVAEVSEAHGYDTNDVYDVRSMARSSLVSKKYLKILLRLSDLLDVSENRVANAVLLNNSSHMSPVSLFHWVSHQSISGYHIETSYNNKLLNGAKKDAERKSYISKGAIVETITIKFNLNVRNNLNVGKTDCLFCHLKENDSSSLTIAINTKEENVCDCRDCNFICRWMVSKNQYLFIELYALQKYLNRSNSNFFDTQFRVVFETNSSARFLKPEEQTIIKGYLNG